MEECKCRIKNGHEYENKIREERGSYYGPVKGNHVSIGMIWGGILTQLWATGFWVPGMPLPPETVCLMMAGVKISRESFRHHPDNIVDGRNYLAFAQDICVEEANSGERHTHSE